ncbi:hypothetical protein BPAE_0557g00030 [Botrytis paeoniae]|uniref:Uncharacterized protein n=1 Tax=Botrytis paeoniae TaxID=278948 RepID=A0A4Z1F357_9HELO|nr:hypothetical protein BPAE_0557g00030 [Botrytis paeoniae]
MELATSPSLVKLTCALRDSDGDDDFNLEAIMELTSGLAPNLKEVIGLNLLPGRSLKSVRLRGSWQGLPGFTGGKNWARYTDFAFLQHLVLGGCYDAKTSELSGQTMEWVAQNHSFAHHSLQFPLLDSRIVWNYPLKSKVVETEHTGH